MKCPKCKHENAADATECEKCAVVFVHIRNGKSTHTDHVSRTCPWNDHGAICGLVGSMSDSTTGSGPWYCSKHFWQLKGWPERDAGQSKPRLSYREQWYLDRGLPYEPPKLGDVPPWRCVGRVTKEAAERIRADGNIYPDRPREPGDDDEPYIQA